MFLCIQSELNGALRMLIGRCRNFSDPSGELYLMTKRFKKTGTIWQIGNSRRSQIIIRVCECLHRTYGSSRLGNPTNAVDILVYIILSNRTSIVTAKSTYESLKVRYQSWDDVILDSPDNLRGLLGQAGLSGVRSTQLFTLFGILKQETGRVCLDWMKGLDAGMQESFLVTLPGVSKKVAKCIQLFGFGQQVLPVDTHVFRVGHRLGWTKRNRADQCHEELEALVSPKWRFDFHVNCILHGRKACRSHSPLCATCCLQSYCQYVQMEGQAA